MTKIHNVKRLTSRRKALRSELTHAEAALWKCLQRSQLAGKKFRRQHGIGPYVVDFYCPECRLAVELDGEGHFTVSASEADGQRTKFLESLNVRVLRFENRDVFEDIEFVLAEIQRNLTTPSAPSAQTPLLK